MFKNVMQVMEVLLVLYILAALFGQKMKYDSYAVILFIADLFLFVGLNNYKFPTYLASFSYITLFAYTVFHYKTGIKAALVNCFLAVVIGIGLQMFFYVLVFYLFISKNGVNIIYEFMIDMAGLLVIMFFGRKLHLKELSDFFMKRNKLLAGIVIFVLVTLGRKIYLLNKTTAISTEGFIETIYFLLLFFFAITEWQKTRSDAERQKAQLEMNRLYYDAYEELITLVRERQHEMKNHLTAILGMIHTTDSYEELAGMQEEYCNCILERNETTKILLTTDNPLIAGFLYRKTQIAKGKGIETEYTIDLNKKEEKLPEYDMVDMLGILTDNAIEALEEQESEVKKIQIFVGYGEDGLQISVANSSRTYEIEEVNEFFKPGVSSKGKGRGIGLPKLKRLADKKGGEIVVANEKMDGLNYLKFTIRFPEKRQSFTD